MAEQKLLDLDQLIYEQGARLEITGGIPTWEASPSPRHQKIIFQIQTSIEPLPESRADCACYHLADTYIRFADGSLKRPDIGIFCTEPPDQDEALTMIPEAIIEIISPGYEYKDVVLNPHFYLAQGVKDVVIVDPRSKLVTHYRTTEVANHYAPITLEMQCGCQFTVP